MTGHSLSGIAGFGTRLYCSPYWEYLLVVHPATQQVSKLHTGEGGPDRWKGIAPLRPLLYLAPSTAEKVLVVYPGHERVWGLDSSRVETGGSKWYGIAETDARLYAAPLRAEAVLVVIPPVGSTSTQSETATAAEHAGEPGRACRPPAKSGATTERFTLYGPIRGN